LIKRDDFFSRREQKFLLTPKEYEKIFPLITEKTVPDPHGKSTIQNLYMDTPNNFFIRKSLTHPLYKEKVRLRSYTVPKDDTVVFLEIKKKYNKVVYKRREKGEYKKVFDYINGGEMPKDSQIYREIDYVLGSYPDITPKMYIAYDRIAFYDKTDENIRISFDSNILYRDYDLDLRKGVYGKSLIGDNIIMEIKVAGAYPLWLVDILESHKIRKTSFSKYGKAYTIELKEKQSC